MPMIAPEQLAAARFIARLIGPVFVIAGAAMILNTGAYQAIIADFVKSPALIYIAGFLALLGGLALVNVCNSWKWGWPLFITIIGWLAVIGGIVRMALPQLVEALASELYANTGFVLGVGIVVLLVGAFVSFKGYSA